MLLKMCKLFEDGTSSFMQEDSHTLEGVQGIQIDQDVNLLDGFSANCSLTT